MFALCKNAFRSECNPWISGNFLVKALTNDKAEYITPEDFDKADQICFSCANFRPRPGQYVLSDKDRPQIKEPGIWIYSMEDFRSQVMNFANRHDIASSRVAADFMAFTMNEPHHE